MSEPVQTTEAPETAQEPAQEAEQPKTYTEDEVKALRAEAAKYRTRLREEEQARRAAMTDSERAIAEAEERGRTAVRTEYGQRLARTEFAAEVAKRNPQANVGDLLEYVDLGRFIGEDGEPDSKEIAKAVARLIPEASATPPPPPSFDGGTRQPTTAGPSMTELIRQAAGRA